MKKLLLFCSLFLVSIITYGQDVWLQNHFSPNSGFRLSNAETVVVLVNNNSGVIMPSNTITVKYQVDNGTVVSQLLSSNLTPGASWNFSFNVKADLSAFGAHTIKVWVERPGDTNNLNNELIWTVNNTCIEMNQPANIDNICGGTTTPIINFTSNLPNVGYTWTNSNPAIGLAASGLGAIPSFTAVNTGTSTLTSTITVRPHYVASQTFNYTGSMQTYVVPAGVTKIKIDARGAQGESAIYNQPGTRPDDLGGKGGRVVAEYPVTPGQTIYVFVGGNTGYNGGGNGGGSIAQPKGGGASDIRIGGTDLTNRIIVAGGGGGGGNNCAANAEPGGAGGGLIGETGYQCNSQTGAYTGMGGTQSAGGVAGVGTSSGGSTPATAGQLGLGGNAGIFFGTAAGGGGGGYYGGGGAAYGGGGGGSSYTDPLATSVVHTQGFQDGSGQIIISYYNDECGSAYDKTFTITVKPQPIISSLTPTNQTVVSAQTIAVITPTSSLTGTTFTWTRDNSVNVTGMPISGNGTISGSLTNTTTTAQTVTFTVTPSADGCVGAPVTATVLVKLAQSIGTIANIAKNYGDADFELAAAASSGLTVSYVSSDNNIAEAYQDAADNNKWKLKVKKAGLATITATQTGNSDYYEASPVDFTLTVNKIPLTITANAQQKVYDSGTYTGGAGVVYGNFVNNEDASVLLGTLSYSGDSQGAKNVGNYVIMPTGLSSNNYDISYQGAQLEITPFALTVSATANNKVYDATNNAIVNLTSNAFTGDNLAFNYITATFNDENVANSKPISVSGISLSGTDAGNYTFNTTANTTANITPFALTISATGNNRVYNATSNATVNLSSNAFAGDNLILAYTSATFNNKVAANGKPVAVSGISLSGTDVGNYTFNTTANTMANITPFALTISATVNNKVYNGNTDAAVSLSHNGFAGDVLVLNNTSASFDNKNVGNGKAVSISGISLSGADASNYIFSTTASATAAITPATLNIVAQAKTKTYGDADPVLTYTPTGLIGTDAIVGSLARSAGENVNTYLITQGTLSAGSNYVLAFTGANLAINKANLTVTATNAARCFGQANPSFVLSYSGFKLADNENSLSNKPQAATTATVSSLAGNYPIAVSGGSSNNYTLAYANGTLRIDALPTITIIPSKQGTIGKGLTLQLTATGGASYSWANAQGIVYGQNSASLTIRPTTNTTYTVTVTNANGCSSTMSYAVVVADDLSILKATNLLSPNGDGVNDVWKVDNIDMYPQAVVRIFDKAGRIVYTRKGYDNTWDGTYNGQPLAESTYYYIVDLEAGKVLRGYITLVRDR